MILLYGPTKEMTKELSALEGRWRQDKNAWIFPDSKKSLIESMFAKNSEYIVIQTPEVFRNLRKQIDAGPGYEFFARGGSTLAFTNGKTVRACVVNPDATKEILIRAREITPRKHRHALPDISRLRDDDDGFWYEMPHYDTETPLIDMIFSNSTEFTPYDLLVFLQKISSADAVYSAFKCISSICGTLGVEHLRFDLVSRNLAQDNSGNLVLLDPIQCIVPEDTLSWLFHHPAKAHLPRGISMSPTNTHTVNTTVRANPATPQTRTPAGKLLAVLTKAREFANNGKWEELEDYADEKMEEFIRLFALVAECERPNTVDEKSEIFLCLMSVGDFAKCGYRASTGYITQRDPEIKKTHYNATGR
jgi:hypothetical protein